MFKNKFLFCLTTAAGITAGLFLLPFFLKLFAPFIAAFFVAAPCQKIVSFLEKKFHLNRGISSALISTIFVSLVIFLIGFALFQLYSQSKNLIATLPAAIDSFKGQFSRISQEFDGFKHALPDEASIVFENLALGIKEQSQTMSLKITESAFNAAKGVAVKLPDILLFVSIFILSTFFFTKDFNLVIKFFKGVLPKQVMGVLKKAADFLSFAFSSYLKAQLILTFITTALVSVCLWIAGKENPLFWGIVCGLVDVLPLFGTAVILLPWAFFSLIYGDTYSFVVLLIIQAIVFLVRQLAEPKIISHQIGIHPILTLVAVYIGLRYFGILGVVFAPIIMLLGVNFYNLYKKKEQ